MNTYKSLFFGFIFALLIIGSTGTARAELNVNINIGPPPIVVSAPPEVVMIPQTGVYFVPSYSFDIFFYNGYWWAPRGDRWYRSRQHNGPWGIAERRYVPQHLLKVPKNYRAVYKQERPIKYDQWQKQHIKQSGHKGRGQKH